MYTPDASSSSYSYYWDCYTTADNYTGGARCYSTNSGVTWYYTSSYDHYFQAYITPANQIWSDPSNSDTVYTAVKDPVLADIDLGDIGSANVLVTVTAPPNGTAGQTGLKIERDDEGEDWADSVIVRDWDNTYSYTDIVPTNGVWYYKITLRNGDSVETTGLISSLDVQGIMPAGPTGFYGDNVTVDGITWHWIDNSDGEFGFEIQEPGMPDVQMLDSAANSTFVTD